MSKRNVVDSFLSYQKREESRSVSFAQRHYKDREPTFQSFSGMSVQPVAHPPAQADPSTSFVTLEQFMAMSDKWSEQFVRFEALSAWSTAPVETPAAPEAKPKCVDDKEKKKSHKSRKGGKDKDTKQERKLDRCKSPAPAKDISGPENAQQSLPQCSSSQTGSLSGFIGKSFSSTQPSGAEFFYQTYTSAFLCPPELDDVPFTEEHFSEASLSEALSESEDGQLADTVDKPEQMEDMNYRETVCSVHSFMGWDHIPNLESDLSEPDKSNNLWKGKNPKRLTRISVAMPPDDWLCQKL